VEGEVFVETEGGLMSRNYRWRELAREGANRGRIVSAFLAHWMAQQEITSQRELAARLKINPATISWWKATDNRQRTVPGYEHMALLAQILGAPLDELYEAFGLRETPPAASAVVHEIMQVVQRLSPADQELIRELAWARLQRQENHQHHRHSQPQPERV
jgi:transcriptional regulator with XRE-family HTH domain